MKQYTRKQLKEYARLGLARDLTEVDPDTLPKLAAFETMYFNTGSEWIIHDEENTPEGPEDISGYGCYIVADTEEGIRKELAAVAGCAPSDLVIWAFDEFIKVARYKAV